MTKEEVNLRVALARVQAMLDVRKALNAMDDLVSAALTDLERARNAALEAERRRSA